jgi:hypothetical protein
MDCIECPTCGSQEIWIYEYFHLMRIYTQRDGCIDPEHYDEESFPKEEPLTIKCLRCEHEWASEEGSLIEDIVW